MNEYLMSEEIKKVVMSKPISKEIFTKFLTDQMTVKQVKEFTKELNNRFLYIVYKIAEITHFKVDWFDYNNELHEYGKGFFDTTNYHTMVKYTGNFKYDGNERLSDYDHCFPTSWFYTNFEEDLNKKVKSFIKEKKLTEKEKALHKERKENELHKVQKGILNKLTEKEKMYIKFCSLSEVESKKKVKSDKEKKEIAKFIKEIKVKNVHVSSLYKNYRNKTKSPISFENWILKNKEKLEE